MGKNCEEIQNPCKIKAPEGAEEISYEHMALLHSSWRYPKKDEEFGRPIWAFHLIVVAADEVLDRIESVDYTLHPTTYGDRQRQLVDDRMSNLGVGEQWSSYGTRPITALMESSRIWKVSRPKGLVRL